MRLMVLKRHKWTAPHAPARTGNSGVIYETVFQQAWFVLVLRCNLSSLVAIGGGILRSILPHIVPQSAVRAQKVHAMFVFSVQRISSCYQRRGVRWQPVIRRHWSANERSAQ